MLEVSAIGAATAFAAGVVSFLSPCVLPLVPGYVSFVAGTSLDQLAREGSARLRALLHAAFFVLGFSSVFVAFGASASAMGALLLAWRRELAFAAGAVILFFGLQLLGIVRLGMLQRDLRFHIALPGGRVLAAWLLGAAFAFGWTPCIGPVLGAILTMTATTASFGQGTVLLTVYSLGLGLPFLLAAWFTDALLRQLRRLSRIGRRLQQGAGTLLVLMGLLVLTGQLERVAYWLLETFPVFTRLG
ncbi:Thiol:disulfide interchange protein DsbD [bacterium HR40]|nr:Thiol:disulfide interchange protein DsbD [bacterium HR40]